jgi:UDP-N-acetylmuramoylalanine--D-glutamate ligase
MIPVTTFRGKTIAVFGLGSSGLATGKALLAGGARVAAWDDGAAARTRAEAAGLPLVDLAAADWSLFAALVLAPGVPLTHPKPHWTVEKARAAGIEIIGDIELFFRERAALAPEATVIAVTGTNGKSTTTALIAHILREAGRDVQMGGNIGVDILTLAPFAPGRIYVVEMSSFQIDLTTDRFLKPTIGVLLNITPDHLDRHGPADDPALALRNYAAIKRRVVESARMATFSISGGKLIDVEGSPFTVGHVSMSSANPEFNSEVHHHAQVLAITERSQAQRLISIAGIASLRGRHNEQNSAVAYLVCRPLGVKPDVIAAGFRTFPGLPHRMEEVGRAGKVLFVNDSKATNADSTEKALASWPGDIFWIVGGKAKEGGVVPLAPYFSRIAKAYLIGASSEDFAITLEGKVPFEKCGTLDVALAKAAADAAASAGAEPVVLLSPACASYDQFRSFEHRGDTFRALVAELPDLAGAARGR